MHTPALGALGGFFLCLVSSFPRSSHGPLRHPFPVFAEMSPLKETYLGHHILNHELLSTLPTPLISLYFFFLAQSWHDLLIHVDCLSSVFSLQEYKLHE